VQVPQRRGDPVTVSRDEGVRPDSTPEALAKLRTIMPGGTVTAGNASQQNDAAAACLVVAEDRLGPLGLEPLGFLAGWAAAGCDPATMGIGPVPAVERLFYRTGLGFSAMDLIELNEAFATGAGMLATGLRELAGTCWRPCARAAARAWPRSSRRPKLGRNLGPSPPPHLQILAVPSRP
jgi:Thiolase, N-terminal domain/Thiolase, C-terminal domain